MSAKSKKSTKCAISMSLALELITQAADRPGVSADLAESFLRTVIAAVASRQYITADFFSPYGEAGRKMYETLKAALERSDRARAAAARRKARREVMKRSAVEERDEMPPGEKAEGYDLNPGVRKSSSDSRRGEGVMARDAGL